MSQRLQKYTKEWLEELCKSSFSYREVLTKAGRQITGGNSEVLKKKIKEFNIDISHFSGKGWRKATNQDTSSKKKIPIEEMFIENSPYQRAVIRRRILLDNLLDYKCSFCGNIGFWNNKELSLQLDHINDINNDNRLENLRWLCPNCHSQTETFSGHNKKETIDFSTEIPKYINDISSASDLLLKLGLSINGTNLYKIKYEALKLGYQIE